MEDKYIRIDEIEKIIGKIQIIITADDISSVIEEEDMLNNVKAQEQYAKGLVKENDVFKSLKTMELMIKEHITKDVFDKCWDVNCKVEFTMESEEK